LSSGDLFRGLGAVIAVIPGSLSSVGTADINALPVSVDIICFLLTVVSEMTADESKLYDLICRSYIAQFYPDYEYDKTSIEINTNR
jgi:hypothetical protein